MNSIYYPQCSICLIYTTIIFFSPTNKQTHEIPRPYLTTHLIGSLNIWYSKVANQGAAYKTLAWNNRESWLWPYHVTAHPIGSWNARPSKTTNQHKAVFSFTLHLVITLNAINFFLSFRKRQSIATFTWSCVYTQVWKYPPNRQPWVVKVYSVILPSIMKL